MNEVRTRNAHVRVDDGPYASEDRVQPFCALLRALRRGNVPVTVEVVTSSQPAHTLRVPDAVLEIVVGRVRGAEVHCVREEGGKDEDGGP